MPVVIKIRTNKKLIDFDENNALSIIISPDENNALSIENKQIVVTKGEDGDDGHAGGTSNIPGNGISGEVGTYIDVLRCNNSVSRVSSGDPIEQNEGVIIFTGDNSLVNQIKNYYASSSD